MSCRVLPALLTLLISLPALPADHAGLLSRYSALELLEIENERNERGEKLPDVLVPKLRREILHAIASLDLFHRLEEYQDPNVRAPEVERIVQMKVRIVGYTGAQNRAGVTAFVHFIDSESQKEIFRKRVNAKLRYDSGGATSAVRKLGRSTGKLVRDIW